MTRSYAPRASRITQPIAIIRRPIHPSIEPLGFTCFRLIPTSDGLQPCEVYRSSNRMMAFVTG